MIKYDPDEFELLGVAPTYTQLADAVSAANIKIAGLQADKRAMGAAAIQLKQNSESNMQLLIQTCDRLTEERDKYVRECAKLERRVKQAEAAVILDLKPLLRALFPQPGLTP